MYGDRDTITPVMPSVAIIRATMAQRPHNGISIEVFPGADHAMRIRQPDGRRVIAPDYLDRMNQWLRRTLAALS
jgi:dienelactone hydrolase